MPIVDLAGFRAGARGNAPLLEWRQTTIDTTIFLAVVVAVRDVGGSTITGVTFNGVSLNKQVQTDTNGNLHIELWTLRHPPTEVTADIEVTMTGTDPAYGLSSVWNRNAF